MEDHDKPDEVADCKGIEQAADAAGTPTSEPLVLRIGDEGETDETSTGADADEEEPTPELEDMFGADDQPLGTAGQLADDRLRLTLSSSGEIERMSASEREDNTEPFIARIRQHFGLEEG